jgi:hypothetical protein
MQPRSITLALALARTRLAIGAAALVAPGLLGRAMWRREGADPAARMFGRMLGGRDIALGLGVVIAIDRGAPVRGWLEAGALADGVDFLSAVAARRELSSGVLTGTAASAGGAALLGLWLSRKLDPSPPPEPGQPEAALTGHPS